MQSREMKRLPPPQLQIIKNYLKNCPVKVGQLARALGVAVRVANLPTGISGQIRKENCEYIIRVNRYEARERQRFTIGHELAHFLLHRDLIDKSPDGITDNVLYRSGKPEQVEFEANRLAADLIMPLDVIDAKLNEEFGGVITEEAIESLASTFEVSKAAMEIRLSVFFQDL